MLDAAKLEELVSSPVEGLNVELKTWIDPDSPHGIAKIVRACLALRNRNGGYLLIGFDDQTGHPSAGAPDDVRAQFYIDKIQQLVSKYAYEPFAIEMAFGNADGAERPVIAVPSGVKSPVAAKADLVDGGKTLIKLGDVYFRTFASNGVASTSAARPGDWREIMEICADNREADIGRFLRRHLAGSDLSSLLSQLGVGQQLQPIDMAQQSQPAFTLRTLVESVATRSDAAFARAIGERVLSESQRGLFDLGTWSVALKIDPPKSGEIADSDFLSAVASSNPRYTGWPIWLDSSGFKEPADRPYVRDDAWESLIVASTWSPHADFQRMSPAGEFYLQRIYQDDTTEKVKPGSVLDPFLMAYRIAEVIAVGLAFGRRLGWEEQSARLGFLFRWHKLKGRKLVQWADTYGGELTFGTCQEEDVTEYVELSLDTAPSAIAPTLDAATRRLFAAFGGYRMPISYLEARVQELISRR